MTGRSLSTEKILDIKFIGRNSGAAAAVADHVLTYSILNLMMTCGFTHSLRRGRRNR
jgi:hypothetical protein